MKRHIVIKSQRGIRIDTVLPGDKSIAHRAIIFGALAEGKTLIRNFPDSKDCLQTVQIFRSLGVRIRRRAGRAMEVSGQGLGSLQRFKGSLYCGNSGTTMRLLAGLLSAQKFKSILTGDKSLSQRPMNRVVTPLCKMGARLSGSGLQQNAPLVIEPSQELRPIVYRLPVESAQVKSAILLAGLSLHGKTVVIEKVRTRDHTEKFLKAMGAYIQVKSKHVSLKGGRELRAISLDIPGDISSAAYLMAIGLLVPESRVCLRNILWNPTRTGLIRVLKRMGARIRLKRLGRRGPEPTADLIIQPSKLKATAIRKQEIASLVDELPLVMVLATQAAGWTRIHGAGELRVKETDRIRSMATGLKAMGAPVRVKGDDISIKGPILLKGNEIRSFGDHRTAMSFIVAGMIARGETRVKDIRGIQTSFPSFLKVLSAGKCKFKSYN